MFNLYYLVDQAGDVYGEKSLVGAFTTLALAQAKAAADAVAHYSVEQSTDISTYLVVFIQ